MQDRSRQLDENLLQRTAGPYIRVNRVGLTAHRLLPLYPRQRTSSDRPRQVRFVTILLQKSFWGNKRNFLEPLMRFASGDVRDHIVLSKIDQEPPWWP